MDRWSFTEISAAPRAKIGDGDVLLEGKAGHKATLSMPMRLAVLVAVAGITFVATYFPTRAAFEGGESTVHPGGPAAHPLPFSGLADPDVTIKKFNSPLLNTGAFTQAQWWGDIMVFNAVRQVSDPSDPTKNVQADANKLIVVNVTSGTTNMITLDVTDGTKKFFYGVFQGYVIGDNFYIGGAFGNGIEKSFQDVANITDGVILKIPMHKLSKAVDSIGPNDLTQLTDPSLAIYGADSNGLPLVPTFYSTRKLGDYVYLWGFSFDSTVTARMVRLDPTDDSISLVGDINALVPNFSPMGTGMGGFRIAPDFSQFYMRYYPDPMDLETYNEVPTTIVAYKHYHLDDSHILSVGGGSNQDLVKVIHYTDPTTIRYKLTATGAAAEGAVLGDVFSKATHTTIGSIRQGLAAGHLVNDAPFTMTEVDVYGPGLENLKAMKQLYYTSPEEDREYWKGFGDSTGMFSNVYTVVKDGKVRQLLNDGHHIECDLDLPVQAIYTGYSWTSDSAIFTEMDGRMNGALVTAGASPGGGVTPAQIASIGTLWPLVLGGTAYPGLLISTTYTWTAQAAPLGKTAGSALLASEVTGFIGNANLGSPADAAAVIVALLGATVIQVAVAAAGASAPLGDAEARAKVLVGL